MLGLIAALGIGSIIAALFGWFVVISNHRQAWINALREDLAEYFKQLELMHYAIGDLLSQQPAEDLSALENRKREARVAVLFVYRRIQLRLNRNEEIHIDLASKLMELQRVETKVPNQALVEDTVDLARRVLKAEWEVAKWGPFVRPVRWWRERTRDPRKRIATEPSSGSPL